MGYFQQVLCCMVLSVSMISDCAATTHHKGILYHRTFVNNHAVYLPPALLSLSDGDHRVNFHDQDVVVTLQKQSANFINATFSNVEGLLDSSPFLGLLLEILNSSAKKQSKLEINANTADVRNETAVVLNCL